MAYCPPPRRRAPENPWSLASHLGLFTALMVAALTFLGIVT
jgi:hypothetical protein